jgi:addiction module HigA family antidote
MPPVVHPGRLLKRELSARGLSANRLALDIGVPSGRITDILNGRRSITAETAVRLGHYFGNSPQFWLDLQGQYDIAVVERDRGAEIIERVRPKFEGKYGTGLDSHIRDSSGEIHHKRSDMLVGTLRETYGPEFAKGYRSDVKLGAAMRSEKAALRSGKEVKSRPKSGRRSKAS